MAMSSVVPLFWPTLYVHRACADLVRENVYNVTMIQEDAI